MKYVFVNIQGTRNTGAGIAGKNIANPSAMLFASTLMLKYVGYGLFIHFIFNKSS